VGSHRSVGGDREGWEDDLARGVGVEGGVGWRGREWFVLWEELIWGWGGLDDIEPWYIWSASEGAVWR
jgi:hypothetical protein